MSEIKDGGSAFPFHSQVRYENKVVDECDWGGMKLRDFFAGHALAGNITGLGLPVNEGSWNIDTIARDAYEIADRMIAERSKSHD